MNKRRIHLKRVLCFLIIPILLLSVSITLAFMFKSSEEAVNVFIPAKVTCEVKEQFNGTQKSSITIQNTGNTAAYLRLHLISYWVDADGNIVGKESEMPAVSYNNAYWLKGEGHIYYYALPVAAGDTTSQNLLTAPIALCEDSYLGETVYQVVEVFAEGIQSEPPNAVQEAWGVTVKGGNLSVS